MPLIAGAVVTALVGIGAAAWLLLREPEPAAFETTTIAPAMRHRRRSRNQQHTSRRRSRCHGLYWVRIDVLRP